MATKKYKKGKRKNYKKKYNNKRKTKITTVKSKTYGFPDIYKTKLKFADTYHLTSTSFDNQIFRANSLNDPDFTGVGIQPRFYDQITAIYDKYLVMGCKMRVEVINQSTTVPARVGIVFSDVDPSTLTFFDIQESRYGKTFVVGTADGFGTRTKTMYMPMKKMLGQNSLNSDPFVYTQVGNNPTDPVFCGVLASPSDGVSTVNVYCAITLTYYCLFKGVKNVGPS